MDGGELIGTGSKTCVFKPSLPCKDNKHKGSDKHISKVYLTPKSTKYMDNEIIINEKIYNIKKSEIWSIVLFNKCDLDNYEEIIKVEKDMEKCLLKHNVSINDFNENKLMLYGLYGGIKMKKQINKLFKKTLSPNLLIKFMKQTHSLFYGIDQLHKNNLLHFDIKNSNIVFQNKKFKLIDFGLSTDFDDIEYIKKRITKEYASSRIYPYYPFDLYFIFLDSYYLDREIRYQIFNKRENYKTVYFIHNVVFNRDIENEIIKIAVDIKNKKIKLEQIIESIDTYSLGFTIIKLIIIQINDTAYLKEFKDNSFASILNHPKVKPIINLLKKMTELDPTKRIKPAEALKSLEKILKYKPKY